MPGVKTLKSMNEDMRKMKAGGAACHVGASYYLHGTDPEAVKIDQNRDDYKTVLICAGAYLQIVAPGSTLTQSPAFMNATDEATAEYGDWVAECRAYAKSMDDSFRWACKCDRQVHSWGV